ncbi:MAG: hypothetical protein AAFV93_16120, partial [Chloroflexota bacterium]
FVNNTSTDGSSSKSISTLGFTNEKKTPNLSEFMRELNRQQKDNLQQKAVLPLTQEQIDAFEKATLPK